MKKDSSRAKPPRQGSSNIDKARRLVDEDTLEAIRRQLSLEYGRPKLADDTGQEDLRRRANRRVAFLLGGLVVGCAVATLVTTLYLRRGDSPGTTDRVPLALRPDAAAPNSPAEPPRPESAPPALTTPSTASPAPPEPPPPRKARAADVQAKQSPPSARPVEPITLPPRPAREALQIPPARKPERSAAPPAAAEPDIGPPRSSPAVSPPTLPDQPTPRAQLEPTSRAAAPPAPADDPRVARTVPGMTRYSDPQRLFAIEYPLGWHVRAATAGVKRTAFYLDDPDEGIAMVLSRGSIHGNLRAAALTPILSQQIRQRYPDFTFTTVLTRSLPGGTEQSRVSALWTNRWSQRMRTEGMIVSTPQETETVYSYLAGQAQELVFPGVEPIFQRMLESFQAAPRG